MKWGKNCCRRHDFQTVRKNVEFAKFGRGHNLERIEGGRDRNETKIAFNIYHLRRSSILLYSMSRRILVI